MRTQGLLAALAASIWAVSAPAPKPTSMVDLQSAPTTAPNPTPDPAGETERLPWPMDYTGVLRAFGSPQADPVRTPMPSNPFRSSHEGIDLLGAKFAPVFASEPGRVVFVKRDGEDTGARTASGSRGVPRHYGSCTIYREAPTGRFIHYLHLDPDSITVRVGDCVKTGQLLGEVAPFPENTTQTDHLHVEVSLVSWPKVRSNYLTVLIEELQDPEPIFEELKDSLRPQASVVLRGTSDTIELANGEGTQATGQRWLEVDVVERVDATSPNARFVLPPKLVHVALTSDTGTTTIDYDLTKDDPDRTVRRLTDRTRLIERLSFGLYEDAPAGSPPHVGEVPLPPLAPGNYSIRAIASDSIGEGPPFEAWFTLSD